MRWPSHSVLVRIAALALLCAGRGPTLSRAEEAESPRFLRLLRDDEQRLEALQTAVVTFRPKEGAELRATVDLVAAIHIGDAAYYQQLNRRFGSYDAVLYELVSPQGAPITKQTRRGGNPITALQMGLKGLLDLEFQLDSIDYTRPNFRHADFTPEEFARSMQQRGETISGWLFEMLGDSLAEAWDPASSISDAELLAAVISRDRARRLKMLFARQLDHGFEAGTELGGQQGSTLISERNKRALQVLRREIDDGKQRLAIFYGAAHLPDLARRLTQEFPLAATGTQWYTAWRLDTDTE